MTSDTFDYSGLVRRDLPPPAVRWSGFPTFNFIGGHNDADSVPVDDLIAAASRVLARDGRALATYGLNSGALGYLPLREFVAAKLGRDAGIACSPDEVLITSGSLQGLDLVNGVMLERGDTVIVERMTYGGTLTRLKRLGVDAVGVGLDDGGMRMDELEATLRDLARRGIRPKFIYTIPTVQNPTATVLDVPRRERLLALSREYGVPIFEDDCYADLTWDGRRPPALRAMDDSDRVIHIGSFSKSIAPGLRLGFIVAGWPLMSRILSIKGDGGTGALEQMILAEYCPSHFDAHVVTLRSALKAKLDALVAALKERFGPVAQFEYPAGGIFLWVKFPTGVDTTRLVQAAAKEGVAVNPGAEWMTDAVEGQSWIRICFANADADVLRRGVARLAEVYEGQFGAIGAGGARPAVSAVRAA